MSLASKREMLSAIKDRYQQADKKLKRQILDGFVLATNYDRKYAIKLLNKPENITKPAFIKKGRPSYYDGPVIKVLEMIWHASNQISSKRIVPFIPEFLSSLEHHGHLHLDEVTRKKVLSVSPATFDRLVHSERTKARKGVGTTRNGGILKTQIKVRTFSDWSETKPGFFECDLVAHCAENTQGQYINTLVMTDIVTTWTECIPLIKRSSDDVILGLDSAKAILPCNILGIDCDNGSEFINYALFEYCQSNNITFTRSRAYKKNDQAHVESKNGSIVRRLIGYDRFEGPAAFDALTELYAKIRLYVNFFQPSLKLASKVRDQSKITRRYEQAKTPCQRVLSNSNTSEMIKNRLMEQFRTLDPIKLQKEIRALQQQLWALAVHTQNQSEESDTSPALFYKRPKKTVKQSRQHDWKTRLDPFENVIDAIKLKIRLNPQIKAKQLLNELMGEYPKENFRKNQLRTLQRRVKELKEQFYSESYLHHSALKQSTQVDECKNDTELREVSSKMSQ